jgi:hypothetical protein
MDGIFFIFHLIRARLEDTKQSTSVGGTDLSPPARGSELMGKGELALVSCE